jgi:HSP20 family protein
MAYGSFTRTFALPTSVDPDKIRAESKQGVLSIHLQKRTEAKPRSIQVKVQ